MTTYTVRAKPWEHGWELHIDGLGVTQIRVLAEAEQQVRDYVATLTGTDTTGHRVRLRYDLDCLEPADDADDPDVDLEVEDVRDSRGRRIDQAYVDRIVADALDRTQRPSPGPDPTTLPE